jgi:hypothetical protein
MTSWVESYPRRVAHEVCTSWSRKCLAGDTRVPILEAANRLLDLGRVSQTALRNAGRAERDPRTLALRKSGLAPVS